MGRRYRNLGEHEAGTGCDLLALSGGGYALRYPDGKIDWAWGERSDGEKAAAVAAQRERYRNRPRSAAYYEKALVDLKRAGRKSMLFRVCDECQRLAHAWEEIRLDCTDIPGVTYGGPAPRCDEHRIIRA